MARHTVIFKQWNAMPGLLAHMGNTYHYSVKWGKKYTKVKYLKYNPS